MPIKINLLAESQHAEDLRRRDPVKRGIWIAGFLVFLVVLYITKLQLDVWQKQREFKQLEERWAKLEPEFKKVTDNKKEVDAIIDKLALLDQLHTNRFLWGSALNALQHTMVDNIQVTRLTSDQSFNHQDGVSKTVNNLKVFTPGASYEKITLTIAARDTNPTDGGQPNFAKFKDALSNYDFFQKKLGKDGFLIDGAVSQSMPDPLDPAKTYKTFTLVAKYPEIRHDD